MSYRIADHKYGKIIYGTIPVSDYVPLIKQWAKDGYDAMAFGIATALGANTVVCRKEDVAEWEAEINEQARTNYPNNPELQWLHSTETGLSSRAIYSALAKHSILSHGETPRDSDDFGRCLRLVEGMNWRERLPEVGARFPKWRPFVQKWDEIVAAYHAKDHEPFALKMQRLLDECR